MKNVEVRIECIALRLRGVSAEAARTLAEGVSADLMGPLARRGSLLMAAPRVEIGSFQPGTVTLRQGEGLTQARAAVARSIADAVVARLSESGSKG